MLRKIITAIIIIIIVIIVLGIISSQQESQINREKALETQNQDGKAAADEVDNSEKDTTEVNLTEDELNKLKAEIDAMNYDDLNGL